MTNFLKYHSSWWLFDAFLSYKFNRNAYQSIFPEGVHVIYKHPLKEKKKRKIGEAANLNQTSYVNINNNMYFALPSEKTRGYHRPNVPWALYHAFYDCRKSQRKYLFRVGSVRCKIYCNSFWLKSFDCGWCVEIVWIFPRHGNVCVDMWNIPRIHYPFAKCVQ